MRFSLLIVFLAAVALASASTPSSFDVRKQWSHCKYNILDQQSCGGCWAFAASGSFTDRACIAGEAPSGTIMSPEPAIECVAQGCNGGNAKTAWDFFKNTGDGTCTNSCKGGCVPFDAANGKQPKCHKGKCDSGSSWNPWYMASSDKTLPKNDCSEIQSEMQKHGPLESLFQVYNNFFDYFDKDPSAVYDKKSGSYMGNHVVKIMGWGVQGGEDYWLAANSWGTSFAEGGYFKILRGKNFCDFESDVTEGFAGHKKSSAEDMVIFFNQSSVVEEEKEVEPRRLGGAWVEQEDVSADGVFVEAAEKALKLVNEKEGKEMVLGNVLGLRTKVVAGLLFDVTMEVKQGGKVRATVWRDVKKEWSMLDFDYEF